ncbi:MAG: ABC transporter ATP-binding protein, partial [Mesorhizobium sp.]
YEKDPSTATRLAKERSQLAHTLAQNEDKWLAMSAEYEEGTAE